MKKFILFCLISLFASSINAQGVWSVKSYIDEYSDKVVKVLNYNSTEKVANKVPKITARYSKGNLIIAVVVDDISYTDYIANTQYESSKFRTNNIYGNYRYTNNSDDYNEYDLNTLCRYGKLGNYHVLEAFSFPINLLEASKKYLVIKYKDNANGIYRIIRISLD